MKEQKTELYQAGSKVCQNGGLTFGGYLKLSREHLKRTEQQVADLLGISLEFYQDLENDRRYPPAGDLYKRVRKVCDIVDGPEDDPEEFVLNASEFAGLQRVEISPDTVEFLRRNWFARYIVGLIEQVDDDGQVFLHEEALSAAIRDSIYKIAQNRGVEIKLPEIEDDDDE